MKTILIIENHPDVGELFGAYLQQIGYRVLLAANGEQAILKAQVCQEPIHLLLTNVFLPGMNGKQVSQQLQDMYPEMKTIFFSSSGYTEIFSQGINIPADLFLRKPFPINQFAEKIRDLLASPPDRR